METTAHDNSELDPPPVSMINMALITLLGWTPWSPQHMIIPGWTPGVYSKYGINYPSALDSMETTAHDNSELDPLVSMAFTSLGWTPWRPQHMIILSWTPWCPQQIWH